MAGKQYLNAFINNSATIRETVAADIENAAHKAVVYDGDGNLILPAADGDPAVGVILSDAAAFDNGADYIGDALIFGEMDSNGKITVRIDISAVGAGVYVPHFFTDNETSGKNICDNAPVTATVFGGKSYEVKETNVEAWNWTAYLINITEITE